MKKTFSLICFGLLIYSCAPITKCKPYKKDSVSIPQNFETNAYVSYGILKYPVTLTKAKDKYTLQTFIGNLDFTNNLCFYGTCINIPIDISKLLYGDVVDKKDKVVCKDGYTVYQGVNGVYKKMVYIKDGKLYKMDILKPDGKKELSIYFKNKSKEGYYKTLELKNDKIDLNINIEGIKSL